MASELNQSSIPVASPVMAESPVSSAPKRLRMAIKRPQNLKKPEVEQPAPVVVEEKEAEPEPEQEEMITIPMAEYRRLLAIAE